MVELLADEKPGGQMKLDFLSGQDREHQYQTEARDNTNNTGNQAQMETIPGEEEMRLTENKRGEGLMMMMMPSPGFQEELRGAVHHEPQPSELGTFSPPASLLNSRSGAGGVVVPGGDQEGPPRPQGVGGGEL